MRKSAFNYNELAVGRIIRLLLETPIEQRFDTLVAVIKWAVEPHEEDIPTMESPKIEPRLQDEEWEAERGEG